MAHADSNRTHTRKSRDAQRKAARKAKQWLATRVERVETIGERA
jgi:hypothetical protein